MLLSNRRTYLVFLIFGITLLLSGTVHAETGYQDSGIFSINTSNLTGVDNLTPILLVNHLSPSHPNPFNPRTTIKYNLAKSARAHLAVYDLKGSLVKTLQVGEMLAAGPHEAIWNGRDNAGQSVAGGVYLYQLKTDGYSFSRRMTLIK